MTNDTDRRTGAMHYASRYQPYLRNWGQDSVGRDVISIDWDAWQRDVIGYERGGWAVFRRAAVAQCARDAAERIRGSAKG